MINEIATVAVYVEDQAQAKIFWTEQVGFAVAAEFPMGPNAFWLEVAPPGAKSHLVIYPKSMMPDWNNRKPSIVFTTENVQATYEMMKANGVEFLEEPKTMQWGTYATFTDLDGNEFLLKG